MNNYFDDSEIKEFQGFKVNDYVVCVLNNRSSLTVGKEYKILEIYIINDTDFEITVTNDAGFNQEYHYSRFLLKSQFRELILNQIEKTI